jgi:hypothetical protein
MCASINMQEEQIEEEITDISNKLPQGNLH